MDDSVSLRLTGEVEREKALRIRDEGGFMKEHMGKL